MFGHYMIVLAKITTYISQIAAMIVITLGIIQAIFSYLSGLIFKNPQINKTLSGRLLLGHSLSLGLSFLIGASILQSAIAPTWDDIGKLAAIIAIRTILNFFLAKELKQLHSEFDAGS